jgi:hypothetical protein
MADEIIVDVTEPDNVELVEGNAAPETPYLWQVELYLITKYAPEFAEATIFKVRQIALERAKIAKEHHTVHRSIQSLEREILSDLSMIPYVPKSGGHKSSRTGSPRPGIGKDYQAEFDKL